MSSTLSVDSDDDGLTDYEEFFLGTDPTSKDSDGDGIQDRVEQLGYALGHNVGREDIGIIKTDPLDADTDNDLRSDGDEAELVDVELKRWVVRATGSVKSGEVSSSSAYRVYSNPLVADADYDGLVDGEEFFGILGNLVQYRTDPNNANTDGDKRDDGVEVRGGLNPLLDDFRVTVVAQYIEMQAHGLDTPDFDIQLSVRLPDEYGTGGLSDRTVPVLDLHHVCVDETGPKPTPGCGTDPRPYADDRYYFRNATIFLDNNGNPPDRSVTFSLAANQRFAIEGMIREYDVHEHDGVYYTSYVQFDLGGFEGIRPTTDEPIGNEEPPYGSDRQKTKLPVFTREENVKEPIQYFYFIVSQNHDPATLRQSSAGDDSSGEIRGWLAFYIIFE